MLLLKYLLTWGGIGMLLTAAAILARDLYLELVYRRALSTAPAGAMAHGRRVRADSLGADSYCSRNRSRPERDGRRSRQPGFRHARR